MGFQTSIFWAAAQLFCSLVIVVAYPTPESVCIPERPLTLVGTIPTAEGLENLAVRKNGEVLVTSLTSSSVFLLAPGDSAPVGVTEVPGVMGLSGITELEQDVFYAIGLNLTGFTAAPGSTSVWKIDMRGFGKIGCHRQKAMISMVAQFPEAGFFNGMTRLARNDNSHILISDSSNGTIVRVNIKTGDYETVMNGATLQFGSEGLPIGVNGIESHDNRLYFTNFNKGLFAAVPISPSTGAPTGPVDIIMEQVSGDDFAVARDGTRAWLAMNGQNTLVEVNIVGKNSRVVANSTLLTSITSAAFGRTSVDAMSLYITGSEDLNTTSVGRVIRADLAAFLS